MFWWVVLGVSLGFTLGFRLSGFRLVSWVWWFDLICCVIRFTVLIAMVPDCDRLVVWFSDFAF